MALRKIGVNTSRINPKELLMKIGRNRIGINTHVIEALGIPERVELLEEDETLELVVAPSKDGYRALSNIGVCFSNAGVTSVVKKYFENQMKELPFPYRTGYALQITGRLEEGMAKFRIADAVEYSRGYR